MRRLEKDVPNFQECIKEINSSDGWTKFLTEPKRKIWYRKEDGLSCVTVLLESVIEASVY